MSLVALQGFIISEALSIVEIPHQVMGFCTFWDYTVMQRYRDYDDPREANQKIFEFYASSNNRDHKSSTMIARSLYCFLIHVIKLPPQIPANHTGKIHNIPDISKIPSKAMKNQVRQEWFSLTLPMKRELMWHSALPLFYKNPEISPLESIGNLPLQSKVPNIRLPSHTYAPDHWEQKQWQSTMHGRGFFT